MREVAYLIIGMTACYFIFNYNKSENVTVRCEPQYAYSANGVYNGSYFIESATNRKVYFVGKCLVFTK